MSDISCLFVRGAIGPHTEGPQVTAMPPTPHSPLVLEQCCLTELSASVDMFYVLSNGSR